MTSTEIKLFHSKALYDEELSAKLTQGAALKRNGTPLLYAKKLLPRTCYPLRLASLPQP